MRTTQVVAGPGPEDGERSQQSSEAQGDPTGGPTRADPAAQHHRHTDDARQQHRFLGYAQDADGSSDQPTGRKVHCDITDGGDK